MASSGKKKTTMAKRDRENRLRERRQMKQAKKDARKLAAQDPNTTTDPWADITSAHEADRLRRTRRTSTSSHQTDRLRRKRRLSTSWYQADRLRRTT